MSPDCKAAPVVLRLRPHRLPEGVVDLALEEMDVPIVGDLHAGVTQKL